MRHVKRIAIAFGILVGLVLLSLASHTGHSTPRDRMIALDLLKLQQQWETNHNIPSLIQSLTNLPFHDGGVFAGGVLIGRGSVSRRSAAFGIKREECYFIYQPPQFTNTSEWTLYHAWYWYPPGGGKKEMEMHKLLTFTTD